MGPVSFETLPGGDTRAAAVALAGHLSTAGIRVKAIRPAAGGGFDLIVGSGDAVRAREIAADHQ